jgi:hypothetical protein
MLIPLLQAAADESREELQSLWAALLANAMTDGGHRTRGAFVGALKSMDPADALVLSICSDEARAVVEVAKTAGEAIRAAEGVGSYLAKIFGSIPQDTGSLWCASRSAGFYTGSVLHAMSPSAVAQRAEQLPCSFPRRDGRIARHLDPPDRGPVYGGQYAAPNRNMVCIPYCTP